MQLADFNPRSPRGGATMRPICHIIATIAFQSTLPTRGSDLHIPHLLHQRFFISIHAPHEGERHASINYRNVGSDFNPRSPRGGATTAAATSIPTTNISIHAPHEGERLNAHLTCFQHIKFQSTLPTRGSDYTALLFISVLMLFQSTLPTRGSDSWMAYGQV